MGKGLSDAARDDAADAEANAADAKAPADASHTPGALHLSVNGEAATLPPGATVADLLAARGAMGKPCAVEVNREIVPKSLHATQVLCDGDAVEIVSFVGGG